MKSIAVFNNKGGVGKTTLLCNLAAYLAIDKNRRVLLVDADPQCNATQNLFPDDVIHTIYDNRQSFTIYSVIRPLSLGRGYSEEIHPRVSNHFRVDIIVGDPRLGLTEDLLANDWSQAIAGDTRGLRTTLLFHQLLSLCTAYDYVIFDMGPSLGSINRAVLIAADYFISPMSIDIFSLRAIENITISIDKWRKSLRHGLEINEDADELPYAGDAWRLKFAGYITQQYLARKDSMGERRAVNAYERIMRKVPELVEREFVSKLQPGFQHIEYLLGSVPNLHSLIPMSQSSRKSIFELRARDGVVGVHFTKVRESRDIFREIADRLEENLKELDDPVAR
jgi:cellulose biosynthesis protein BcsQ